MTFGTNNIKIEKQVISLKNLPQTFNKTKIVFLSDIHSLWFGFRERKVLEIIKKLKPDFVFITGDFIDPLRRITDRRLRKIRIFWEELGKEYKNQIFGVMGNHDNRAVERYLKESGIIILNNENRKLIINSNAGENINLIGVEDPYTGRDNLLMAMKGTEDNIPKLLLAHSPRIIKKAVKQKIDLVLAGHTHGGQIVLPFFGPLFVTSRMEGRYASGLFKIDSTYMYVTRGIGTTILPFRFNCPPEITLIELKK